MSTSCPPYNSNDILCSCMQLKREEVEIVAKQNTNFKYIVNSTGAGSVCTVQVLFDIVAHENNVVRTLWTKKIVVAGKKFGLKFDEDWRNDMVEAGPLPALFLREVSKVS